MPSQPDPHTEPLHRVPALFSGFHTLIVAESTRHGGVSPSPYKSLNLGFNTADQPEHTTENRRRFLDALGAGADSGWSARLATSHQVHGTEILNATEPGRFDGYDALMTNKPGLLIGVSIADCVPILIYDQQQQAVAAIHAGWRGTVGGIVAKTLQAMQHQFGTQAVNCYAYVGTCIDESSFVVGQEVADQFDGAFKRVDSYSDTIFVNLKSANTRQLTDFGIPTAQISISTFSTVLNNEDYFSHRAEQGQTGRMLAVIGIKP